MGVSAVSALDVGMSAASAQFCWAPEDLTLVVAGRVYSYAHLASLSVGLWALQGDVPPVATGRAQCVPFNFDEVVDHVSPASDAYAGAH